MKKVSFLLIGVLLARSGSALADSGCAQPVTLLDVNQASPCRGWLFSPEKEVELYKEDQSYKLLQQQDLIKDNQISLYKDQITNLQSALDASQKQSEVWQNKAIDYNQKYSSIESDTTKRDVLFYAAGILTVLLSALAYHYVANH